jgi:hypothetical protein
MNLTKKLRKELRNKINRGCHTPIEAIFYFLSDEDYEEELHKEIKDCEFCQLAIYFLNQWTRDLIDSDIVPEYEVCREKTIQTRMEAIQKHLDKERKKSG